MSDAETILALTKKLRDAQRLIHVQRARERRIRATRLAIVAGGHAEEVDSEAEEVKADEILTTGEAEFEEITATLKFYAARETYEDASKLMSLTAPIGPDKGRRARDVLRKMA